MVVPAGSESACAAPGEGVRLNLTTIWPGKYVPVSGAAAAERNQPEHSSARPTPARRAEVVCRARTRERMRKEATQPCFGSLWDVSRSERDGLRAHRYP